MKSHNLTEFLGTQQVSDERPGRPGGSLSCALGDCPVTAGLCVVTGTCSDYAACETAWTKVDQDQWVCDKGYGRSKRGSDLTGAVL